jgi:GDP-L-fucose synthase
LGSWGENAHGGILAALDRYDKPEPVNLGSGREISIRDLVEKVAALTGFHGQIVWDASKPNGQPRRCLDVTRAENEFGFRAQTSFDRGLRSTIDYYLASQRQSQLVTH